MLQISRWIVCVIAWLFPIFDASLLAEEHDIAGTVRKLQAIHITEYGDTEVPAAARPLLQELKHQLRDLITVTLNKGSGFQRPGQAEAAVRRKLAAMGVKVKASELGNEPPWSPYGEIVDLRIRRPKSHRDTLVAVTTLGIMCGRDSSIYVYRKHGKQWDLVIVQEANDYTEVSGAQGSFVYAISPPDHQGQWFVVVTDVNPWCTSNWQSLRYKVLRAGPSPTQPQVLLSKRATTYLGQDEPQKISVRKDGFQLAYWGHFALDAGILVRAHVENYLVGVDHVRRVPPFALHPHEFVDEWLELPSAEASEQTEPSQRESLQAWHNQLQDAWKYSDGFAFVQPCNASRTRWQIAVDFRPDDEDAPPATPPRLFFTVGKKAGAFVLERLDEERPLGCPGEARPQYSNRPEKLP